MGKTNYLSLIFSAFLAVNANAQSYPLFNTIESIDIANIKAASLVHGDMWWNPADSLARCEFPKGSGKNVGFVADLWMSGYDQQSTLRVSAQTYRPGGATDYWPGPIDTSSATTAAMSYAQSQSWAKIWKIGRDQVDSFRGLSTHTIANTPVPVLEWPAKGNIYAKGAGGTPLNITRDMAPFVDVNADGVYDPLAGDYPLVKGHQMLWWVINDFGATHNINATNSLQMEIKMSAYAYKLGTVADNIEAVSKENKGS